MNRFAEVSYLESAINCPHSESRRPPVRICQSLIPGLRTLRLSALNCHTEGLKVMCDETYRAASPL